MEIKVDRCWSGSEPRLIYRRSEFSFGSVPRPKGGITSVLVNDLQFELDENGTVLYVWGLFPLFEKCESANFQPPLSERRRLRFVSDEELIPGISTRLSLEPWAIFTNHESGWVGVGSVTLPERCLAIEFVPAAIAILDNGNLHAVWLKPTVES